MRLWELFYELIGQIVAALGRFSDEMPVHLVEAVELDLHQGPPTQVPLPTHVPQQPSQLASAAAAMMMVSN